MLFLFINLLLFLSLYWYFNIYIVLLFIFSLFFIKIRKYINILLLIMNIYYKNKQIYNSRVFKTLTEEQQFLDNLLN